MIIKEQPNFPQKDSQPVPLILVFMSIPIYFSVDT